MAYVYKHIRLDKDEVFYIGIGDNNIKYERAYSKYGRNFYWNNIINATDFKVEIIIDNLTWEEACGKEREFIKFYGRKDLGLGTLSNMTDGGDGALGYKHTKEGLEKLSKSHQGVPRSEETKIKISKSHKGKPSPKRGTVLSQEWKDNISKAQTGKSPSQETKNRISESMKASLKGKTYNTKQVMCIENNTIYSSASEAAKKLNLHRDNIYAACNGIYKTTGGLHFKYLN